MTFFIALQFWKFTTQNKENSTFFWGTFFIDVNRIILNVMTTHLNYHNYWGNYTWLSIYISKIKKHIENCEKNVFFFLHFSVFFMKNVWGYPYLKTHNFFFLLKIWPIFFKFWMLTCKWCFWYVVFEYLIKRKGYFFHKINIFKKEKVPTNLWIWF